MSQVNDLLKKRVYALTTDLFIISMTNYFLMAAFTNFLKTIFFSFPLRMQLILISKLATLSSVSLMSTTFAYFTIFYFVTNGRTFGKTVFGLKVVSTSHSEITLIQAMQRSFAYFLCAILGSFLFALSFWRADQKSLADLFSKTLVQYDNPNELEEKIGTEFQLTLIEAIKNESEEKMAS